MKRAFGDYAAIIGRAALCIAGIVSACKRDGLVTQVKKNDPLDGLDNTMMWLSSETKEVFVKANSEGEDLFVNHVMPTLKDKVVCKLGAFFGTDTNRYELSERDFKTLKKFADENDALNS